MQARKILTLAFLLTGAPAVWAGVAEECRQDLDSLPAFLLANDAGGRDAWNRYGEAHFTHAMDEARTAVAAVARTALLTVPSFAPAWQTPVAQLLRKNRAELTRHTNWIIDVRGNTGGSDTVYADIMRWIGAAERTDVQVEYFATAENVAATDRTCAVFAPGDAACEQAMKNERERMQSVSAGSWVLQQAGPEVMQDKQELERVRPSHVAILVDGRCGSSCEQFLLDARQSFSVKLVGQHSYGSLDYSNLRPHALPSGHRTLMYAITRTKRIPGMPVDGIGVMPDVYVPSTGDNTDLVNKTQRWLEGL